MKTCTRQLTLLGILGVALSVASGWASAETLYRLTDLGTLGGTATVGLAINASGQITGWSYTAGNEAQHAYLWNGTTMRDLGSLGGRSMEGFDLNKSGQVAGYGQLSGNRSAHAFLWDGSTTRDLGTFGGASSSGEAINASGQVTGYADLPGEAASHAFLWDGTMLRDLGTLGGANSGGYDINSAGQVTGGAGTAAGKSHAFLWTGTSMRDLGTFGGSNSLGIAINATGMVAGQADTTGDLRSHAFLWNGTMLKDLGTLGGNDSIGWAINAAGQVTGQAQTATGYYRAFLWTGTEMRGLGTLAGRNTAGLAINASGQVTGWAQIPNNQSHAFVSSNGGPMVDLNDLIDPSDPLRPFVTLYDGEDINDRGQIVANGLSRAYLVTPLEYQIVYVVPAVGSKWKRGATVLVKTALVNVAGTRISDSRAAALIATPCKVKFSATGAQAKSAACMKYNATTNEFTYSWKLGTTGTGSTTLKVAATYKFSMPETITTTKSRTISIVQ